MAEYLIKDTTLVGLANSARVITGETKQLSPAEMKEQLMIAKEAIDAQADLIAQISSVLDNKVSGGTNDIIRTCTLSVPYSEDTKEIIYIDASGNLIKQQLRQIGNTSIASPSFIYFPTIITVYNIMSSNYHGYRLSPESEGNYIVDTNNFIIGIHYNGTGNIIFEYIVADNEPT